MFKSLLKAAVVTVAMITTVGTTNVVAQEHVKEKTEYSTKAVDLLPEKPVETHITQTAKESPKKPVNTNFFTQVFYGGRFETLDRKFEVFVRSRLERNNNEFIDLYGSLLFFDRGPTPSRDLFAIFASGRYTRKLAQNFTVFGEVSIATLGEDQPTDFPIIWWKAGGNIKLLDRLSLEGNIAFQSSQGPARSNQFSQSRVLVRYRLFQGASVAAGIRLGGALGAEGTAPFTSEVSYQRGSYRVAAIIVTPHTGVDGVNVNTTLDLSLRRNNVLINGLYAEVFYVEEGGDNLLQFNNGGGAEFGIERKL